MAESGSVISRLLREARRSRAGALDRLLESFRHYLRLLARTGIDASLRGKADPSDLVQEALLKASQHFGQFQGNSEAELAGWLRQILARCLADLGRRYRSPTRAVVREQSLEDILGRSSEV